MKGFELETKGTIKKRRVITDEVPYCIFDGTNFREVMQFAKSQEIRVRWVDGDYQLTIEVDRAFYKITKGDVLIDIGDELLCRDEKGFEEFITDNDPILKAWYSEERIAEIHKWINETDADPESRLSLDIGDLTGLLFEAVNHIEELQNVLKGNHAS